MPMSNPLVNGDLSMGFFGTNDTGSADSTTTARRSAGGGASSGPPVGSGDLTGAHNTPLHIAALIIFGLAVIFGLNMLGFRFAAAAGVGG